jgi:hypothetical protein
LRFNRRRWRSITVSASAIPIRYKSARSNAFSKRESVGCDAKSSPLDRIATTQQLADRIGVQSPRIIAIWITAGDGVQPLAHQIPDRVPDLARLASVIDATDQRLGQPQLPIASLKQDRPTVGTGMFLVKFGDHRLARQIRKQNTLSCAIVIHAKTFVVRQNTCGKAFLARSRPLRFLNS